MILSNVLVLFSAISLTLASESDYLSQVASEWRSGIPVLRDFPFRYDLSLSTVYSHSHRALNTLHLKPYEHIFMPVSLISNVLKAHEQLAKLGIEYDEFFDGIIPEIAPVYAALQIYPKIDKNWEAYEAKFDHKVSSFLAAFVSQSAADQLKKTHVKEVVDLLNYNSCLWEEISQISTEGQKNFEKIGNSNIKATASYLTRAENIMIETSQRIGNNKTAYQKGRNYSQLLERLKYSSKFEKKSKIVESWSEHIFTQMLGVENQAVEVSHECINGVEQYCSRYVVKPIEILDKFIDVAVRKKLQRLCSSIDNDLPIPIFLQLKVIRRSLLQCYSLDNVIKLKECAQKLDSLHVNLDFCSHGIQIGRKAHRFGILMRREMLKIFDEYSHKINTALGKTIVVFGHLGLPAYQFFILLTNLKNDSKKYREDIINQIQALEAAQLDDDTFPVIGEMKEKRNAILREVEFLSAEFLSFVEHFQLKISAEIHDLAQMLAPCPSGNENNQPTPFDCTTETFAQYINRILPSINAAIKKLRNEHFSEQFNESIEDQVVPDFVHQQSDNCLAIESRFTLKEYSNYPLYCPLDRDQNLGPSLVGKNEITIGTFNAEWLFPFPDSVKEDGAGTYIWGSESAAGRHFKRIIEVIALINADILLLQEIQDCRALSAAVEALKQYGITDYSAYLVPNKDSLFGHHVGILSRYQPTEVSFAENTISKNIFSRFHLKNEHGQEAKITIMGLHMIAGEFEEKRNMQARSIVSFLENNLKEDERLLIMGDMNDYDSRVKGHKPYSSCLEILSQSKRVLINPLANIRGNYIKTQIQRGIVDHLLGEKELRFKRPKIHSDLVWGIKSPASDHAPVTAVIRPF